MKAVSPGIMHISPDGTVRALRTPAVGAVHSEEPSPSPKWDDDE